MRADQKTLTLVDHHTLHTDQRRVIEFGDAKWDTMIFDERDGPKNNWVDPIEAFLEFGKRYKVTMILEEIKSGIIPPVGD